jgi:DNA-binding beta-propeller fold protein YncE
MGLRRRIFKVILFCVLAFVVSCAPEKVVDEVPELYWPLPPQRPRIKFVDYIIGSLDVTGSRRGEVTRVLFGEEGETGFMKPVFAYAFKDTVYVSDLTGVISMDFGKKIWSYIGSGDFLNPTGIAASKKGFIYVGDAAKADVFVINVETGKVNPVKGEKFGNPGGLAVDDVNERLIAVDVKRHRVNVYSLEGKSLFSFGTRGIEPGEFNFPYDVATDDEGNIYVVDSGNFRVQKFDKDGTFQMMFGSVGTLAGQFARPKGIDLDSDGNIYVVDGAFGNFQIFDKLGRPLLAVGSIGIEPGQFVLPIGIAISDDDEVYVVDQLNKRIQKFQYIKYADEY